MRIAIGRMVLLMLGLLILGSIGLLLGAWVSRWPRVRLGFVRLGDAAITFALGLLGAFTVWYVLRSLGWWPSPN